VCGYGGQGQCAGGLDLYAGVWACGADDVSPCRGLYTRDGDAGAGGGCYPVGETPPMLFLRRLGGQAIRPVGVFLKGKYDVPYN